MRVRATKTVEYEIRVNKQADHDPDDGTDPGFYAWVGSPGCQGEFAVGPYKSAREARVAACGRLRRMGYTVERADG